MYRPQSQASRRQQVYCYKRKSSDVRELQSKTKKLSTKQYKQYVKRLIQNNPNHIDTDRRLILQNQTNRNQLRQRIQRKNEQDKDMWRSGVVRFIKPRVNERDYKRFKKLFELFNKIQKCKHQMMAINCSAMKYMKEGMSLQQNQRLKELKDVFFKLQTEQQKILLQIQNQSKENRLQQAFSIDKHQIYAKQSHLMHQDHNDSKPTESTQNVLIEHAPSSKHARKQSSLSKKSRQTPNNHTERNNSQRDKSSLAQIFQLMWNLDERLREKVPEKTTVICNAQLMVEGIKEWVKMKFSVIEYLFSTVAGLCQINKKDNSTHEEVHTQDGIDKDNSHTEQSMKSPKSHPYDQVYKSSSIQNLSKKFHQISQKAKKPPASTNEQDSTSKKTTRASFKDMFALLQKQLKEMKSSTVIKQRNNEMAKQLIFTTKQLKQEQHQKETMEKEKELLEKQLKVRRECEELNSTVKKDNDLLKKRNQKLDLDNTKLINEINKMKGQILELNAQKQSMQEKMDKAMKQAKQHEKFQKYYRQTLSLEQQVKILAQQNEKLINQLNVLKEQNAQSQTNPNTKPDQSIECKLNQMKQSKQKWQTHQKSIKQSSNTSLIYKQLEKNNKKLEDQNKKLQDQNKKLTEQNQRLGQQNKRLSEPNHSLSEENQQISQLNHKLSQQSHRLTDENHKLNLKNLQLIQKLEQVQYPNTKIKQQMAFLEQQNTVLLEENKKIQLGNKKIQEEFQQIVKEKLQLESTLNYKNKEVAQLISGKQLIANRLGQAFRELGNDVKQLTREREALMAQVNGLKKSIGQVFECIVEQITSAFGIFVNEFSQQLILHQASAAQEQQTTTPQDQQSSTAQQSQTMDQNLATSRSLSHYQQQIITLTQQQDALLQELNHCMYELNTYKGMLDEVQIEKELQKKYFEQDVAELRVKLGITEKQLSQTEMSIADLKIELQRERQNGEAKQIRQVVSLQAQTEPQQYPTLRLQSQIISQVLMPTINHTNQPPQSRSNNFKINCESFSIIISPKVDNQSVQPITIQSQDRQQWQLLTFESWLDQIKLESKTSTQTFKSFVSINLHPKQSTTNTLNQLNLLKLQNDQLKLQIDKLKHKHILNPNITELKSPLKDLFSPADKTYAQFDNKNDPEEQLLFMGSLYDRFSVPKLQNQPTNLPQSCQQTNQQLSYPPLQKPQNIPQNNHATKQSPNQQDQDQSFDLCIS